MQITEITEAELNHVCGGTTEIVVIGNRPPNRNGSQGRGRSGIGDASSAPSVDYRNPDADTGRHTDSVTNPSAYCIELVQSGRLSSVQDC